MKKVLLAALLLIGGMGDASAQSACGSPGGWIPFASETVTVSTTAVGLTASVYKPSGGQGAQMALITVAAADARIWFDGTAPTSTVGHLITSGQSLTVCAATIPKLRAIRSGSTDVVLSVTYSGAQQ